jgi:hypothetical protein
LKKTAIINQDRSGPAVAQQVRTMIVSLNPNPQLIHDSGGWQESTDRRFTNF